MAGRVKTEIEPSPLRSAGALPCMALCKDRALWTIDGLVQQIHGQHMSLLRCVEWASGRSTAAVLRSDFREICIMLGKGVPFRV